MYCACGSGAGRIVSAGVLACKPWSASDELDEQKNMQ